MARRGRPKREEQDLPPYVQQALVLRAVGANWQQCAEAVDTSTANLREWRKHPDADGFLKEPVRSNLEHVHTLFADAAPRLAERLIPLVLDEQVKCYTAVSSHFRGFQNPPTRCCGSRAPRPAQRNQINPLTNRGWNAQRDRRLVEPCS